MPHINTRKRTTKIVRLTIITNYEAYQYYASKTTKNTLKIKLNAKG
jgi:hypothetical protein